VKLASRPILLPLLHASDITALNCRCVVHGHHFRYWKRRFDGSAWFVVKETPLRKAICTYAQRYQMSWTANA